MVCCWGNFVHVVVVALVCLIDKVLLHYYLVLRLVHLSDVTMVGVVKSSGLQMGNRGNMDLVFGYVEPILD